MLFDVPQAILRRGRALMFSRVPLNNDRTTEASRQVLQSHIVVVQGQIPSTLSY